MWLLLLGWIEWLGVDGGRWVDPGGGEVVERLREWLGGAGKKREKEDRMREKGEDKG